MFIQMLNLSNVKILFGTDITQKVLPSIQSFLVVRQKIVIATASLGKYPHDVWKKLRKNMNGGVDLGKDDWPYRLVCETIL